MATEEDLYDNYDQNPAESNDGEDKEQYGETFLAPKSAFAGKDLEVGAIHKVRIEAVHDQELELRCIKSDAKEEAVSEPEPGATEAPDLYE